MKSTKTASGAPVIPKDEDVAKSLQDLSTASKSAHSMRAVAIRSVDLPEQIPRLLLVATENMLSKPSPAAMTAANRRNKK